MFGLPQVTGDNNLQLLLSGLHLWLPGGALGSNLGAMAWIPLELGFTGVRPGTILTETTLSRSEVGAGEISAHVPVCPISKSTGMVVKGCDLCTQPQIHVHSHSCSRNDRMYKVTDTSISLVYARLFPKQKTQNTKHKSFLCRFVTQMVEVPDFASKSKTKLQSWRSDLGFNRWAIQS